MPRFESPLGNKKITSQPMKELDIPDESGYSDQAPTGGGKFSPSVTKRYGDELDEDAIRNFQAQMQAKMEPELSQEEQEIMQARASKRSSKERLGDGARRRIEMLIGMTRGTRTAEIEDKTYVFQTLKSSEMREAMTLAGEFDGTIQFPFEMRKQLLARSLTHIAGVDIAQFVGSNDFEAKLNLMDEIPDALLNRLYSEYLSLFNETKERYALKSQNDVQEVVEDLKK